MKRSMQGFLVGEWRKTARLAEFMLMGALFGALLGLVFSAVGDLADASFVTTPYRWAIYGAIFGLVAELTCRVRAIRNQE
jgi:hypothetical protein